MKPEYNFGTVLKDTPWNTLNLFLDDMKEFFPQVETIVFRCVEYW